MHMLQRDLDKLLTISCRSLANPRTLLSWWQNISVNLGEKDGDLDNQIWEGQKRAARLDPCTHPTVLSVV